jgi:predicted nucleic-acid-binding protein
MIGLDTNILVRYIVQDDPLQSKHATEFVENHCSVSAPGFINLIVLCELVWVLGRAYGYKKEIITEVIKQILTTKEFMVENSENAWKALNEFLNGKADFSDYIIGYINKNVGCEFTITLDKLASQNKSFKFLKC